jgi:predicted porin
LFKKMLLTLSALTLLMAGAANAGDANWTFYGVGHVSLNSLNNGNDSQLGLTSNTSRFGFKGTADVSTDLTAFWQFESFVDMMSDDYDGGTIGTRNTFVGFKHATAGKFMVGRHDTPFKALGRKVEMFPDQMGDFRAMTMGWDNRLGEIAAWVSPDWDGFNVFAAYQFDQGDPGDEEKMTAMSASAAYATEQFMIGGAYEGASAGWNSPAPGGTYGDGPKSFRLVGKYMGSQFDVAALYQTNTVQDWDYNTEDDVIWVDEKSSVMGVGASFKMNDKWNLKGQMTIANWNTDAVDDTETTDIDESDTKSTLMTFGIERVFTQNVLAYAQFSMMSDGDNSSFDIGGGQSGFGDSVGGTWDGDTWQDPSGISVGTVVTW